MTKERKKILLIHRYFYPDSPPYATILNDIRDFLTQKGYQVDILSGQPSYKSIDNQKKEKYTEVLDDGSKIYRLPVFRLKNKKIEKMLNFFWFPFAVFWFLLFHKKYDVISVSTAPQVLLAYFVAVVAKIKGSKFVYHCMDIHPEIGRLSGEFKNRYIYLLLEKMDRFTCNQAERLIVLSSDMKNQYLKRDRDIKEKITIINNYDISDKKVSQNKFFDKSDGIKRVVFAGNIGRFQYLEDFVSALKNNPPLENFELIFLGEGSALKDLKKLANGVQNIRFMPHQPIGVAKKIISDADLGIVSLQKEIIKYAYPSKTMIYLSEGVPILLYVDKDSEIVDFITSNRLGIWIEYGNIDTIYDYFRRLTEGELRFDSEHIKKVFQDQLSKKQFMHKINSLFTDILEEK
jgi:glycosyltransferase involved in cell wall biosynthesis